MSLEHSPSRQAYTVQEFCTTHRISRSMLYKMWREGTGPRFILIGATKRIITAEGAADWRHENETTAARSAA